MRSARGVESRPRGPWKLAWLRLRRDRWSFGSLIVLIVIFFLCFFGGAIVTHAVGHSGIDIYPYATGENLKAVGPWSHVPTVQQTIVDEYGNLKAPPPGTKTTLFILGADGPLGRDELIRLLDGGRTSLEIAIGAALVALLIGLPLGALAGYFGGWTDAVVSRLTEAIMAFPLLLFLIFASVRMSSSIRSIGWGWEIPSGVVGEAILIGLFTSFYPARLVRVQMITLRHSDFVEAAEMTGASDLRILRRHLVPHLVPTLVVWGAVAVATNILLEVGLSFVGVGVQPTVASWGQLLSTTWGTFFNPTVFNSAAFTYWQTILPTVAILVTVLSLNQVSDGVRRALEPRST